MVEIYDTWKIRGWSFSFMIMKKIISNLMNLTL